MCVYIYIYIYIAIYITSQTSQTAQTAQTAQPTHRRKNVKNAYFPPSSFDEKRIFHQKALKKRYTTGLSRPILNQHRRSENFKYTSKRNRIYAKFQNV